MDETVLYVQHRDELDFLNKTQTCSCTDLRGSLPEFTQTQRKANPAAELLITVLCARSVRFFARTDSYWTKVSTGLTFSSELTCLNKYRSDCHRFCPHIHGHLRLNPNNFGVPKAFHLAGLCFHLIFIYAWKINCGSTAEATIERNTKKAGKGDDMVPEKTEKVIKLPF